MLALQPLLVHRCCGPQTGSRIRMLAAVTRHRPASHIHIFQTSTSVAMRKPLRHTRSLAAAAKTEAATRSASAKASSDAPWMIVGLGNPGGNYDNTRHNVGFMVIDALARSEGIDVRKLERSAAVGKAELAGKKVLLVKPVTFMNNSGESVGALARFYKVPPSQVLVISDDLDQPTAGIKFKQRGGHGGHNGLRSIMQHFQGSQDFPRLKIGIGRPTGSTAVADYVLQPFSKKEKVEIDVAIQESLDIIRSIFALGLDKALSGSRT